MFNPQQKHTILAKLGYNGPVDDKTMEQFVASNPAAAAKIGKFENAAKRIMTPPTQLTAMAEGGVVAPPAPLVNYIEGTPEQYTQGTPAGAQTLTGSGATATGLSGNTGPATSYQLTDAQQAALDEQGTITVDDATGDVVQPDADVAATTTADMAETETPTDKEISSTPSGVIKTMKAVDGSTYFLVNGVRFNDKASAEDHYDKTATLLQKKTDDFRKGLDLVDPGTADFDPTGIEKVAAAPVAQIDEATGSIEGEVDQAQAEQATATTVDEVSDLEAITYDPTQVSGEIAAELEKLIAQTGGPSEKATIRGQMSLLMQDFDQGTPPWASGAMRAAMQSMVARGLGASSMAGAAIVQAAMEAALPIASGDAQTNAQFEMQNLSNRQQTAIFKTQQQIAALLSDQAAENAAKTFNAQSQNQVNMFTENLQASAAQFNASQINAIAQFNAGEKNAINKFNADMKEQRKQYEAKNDVLIQQANVQFRNDMFQAKMKVDAERAVAIAGIRSNEVIQTAALKAQIKMENARLVQQASEAQLAREQQSEQSALERAFQAEQATADRALTVLTTTMSAETQKELAAMAATDSEKSGIGELIGIAVGLK
jgi:hypothetical protein